MAGTKPKRPATRRASSRAINEDLLTNATTSVAPGAGVAIVTLAAPAKGTYRVRVRAGYGGTSDGINNMQLRRAAVALKNLFVPAAVNTDRETTLEAVKLDGTQALSVNAIAAGGAGSIFNAEISAVRVEDI